VQDDATAEDGQAAAELQPEEGAELDRPDDTTVTSGWYALEISGVLTDLWDERLEGWRLEKLPGENTRVTGYVRDQSELYGAIAALRNMGLTLLRVELINNPDEEGAKV